ncbi:hypothetical protein VIGAN_01271600 [Vigna angularis var. angularis]|nr:hypothetical protein VIGAN_01271600 [Vigna angularis var. angularis]
MLQLFLAAGRSTPTLEHFFAAMDRDVVLDQLLLLAELLPLDGCFPFFNHHAPRHPLLVGCAELAAVREATAVWTLLEQLGRHPFSISRHSLLSMRVDGCWKCTTGLDRETPLGWMFAPGCLLLQGVRLLDKALMHA